MATKISEILLPKGVKKKQPITSVFNFQFSFYEDESFDVIVERLDQLMNSERQRAVMALAKFRNVKVNFSGGGDKPKKE